jgi:hypothetical protein
MMIFLFFSSVKILVCFFKNSCHVISVFRMSVIDFNVFDYIVFFCFVCNVFDCSMFV